MTSDAANDAPEGEPIRLGKQILGFRPLPIDRLGLSMANDI